MLNKTKLNIKHYRLLILIIFSTLSLNQIFSQEITFEEQYQPNNAIDENALFVIDNFDFEITGRTRPYALIYYAELQEGETLKGMAELEKYIDEKKQLLVNQRVLNDNPEVTYSIGERQSNGAYLVTINIKVEDSWNIIALPYPKYSTNTGFELTLKARDYNFLGTMNPLKLDIGYHYDENGRSSFLLGLESNTPFKAFGYTWYFKFDNFFNYRPQVEEPYFYQNVTGLSMELPYKRTTFTFGFEESFNLNEENANRYKEKFGDFQKGLYLSSLLYTTWKIPTGIAISKYGELTYTPNISATFNHELPDWPLQSFRHGPFLGFDHALGFEKIDWKANYRKGISVSLNNENIYDFYRFKNEDDPLSISLTFSGIGHFIISDFFAISSRLMYRQWFYHDPDYFDEAGDAIRGIADKSINADYMLSLNMDFPFRILVFRPSKWFGNSKLRFFDFELQMSPVFDISLYNDPKNNISFALENFISSGGIEFIFYPAFMRNLFFRIGYAFNLNESFSTKSFELPGGDNREIYLIMGHHY